MIHTLREFYGLQPAPPADLFQFFVWEILSEHALPARRDLAWHALKRIPALTPDAMFRATAKELSDAVGLAGPHADEKIERIRATVGEFKRHRDELDPDKLRRSRALVAGRALSRLTHLHPGARRRAHLFVLGAKVVPIDDEIGRVISRLAGLPHHRHRTLRRWLANELPDDISSYREAVIYLRHHGQQSCVRVAPHCGVCPLRERCAYRS